MRLRLPIFLALILLFATRPALATEPAPCHGKTVCPIGERGYHVRVPDDWDGETPLPALMHFHGWKRQGTTVIKHSRIAPTANRHGMLLIAPNGLGRSWDFWQADTDDVPFALAVLEDAIDRWPIDPARIYVSGYSWGSSMAWRFACAHGDRIAALLAIAGTLPDQHEVCPSGPVQVRHVHGLSDRVMDYPFGPGGDQTYPVRLWLDKNGCQDPPEEPKQWRVTRHDKFERLSWTRCTSGEPVHLDIHKRGHFIPRGWIDRQLDELLGAD